MADLSSYLTIEGFYENTELSSSDVSEALTENLIEAYNEILVEKLGMIFDLNAYTKKYYATNAPHYILVDVWQEEDLVVKLGNDRSVTLDTLVKDEDFRLIFWKEKNPIQTFPVTAILLKNISLGKNDYLQIEGDFGFSDTVPRSLMLDQKLYDYIKRAVQVVRQEEETGGYGEIQSTSIDKVKIDFGSSNSSTRLNMQQSISVARKYIDSIVDHYLVPKELYSSIIG